jgi:hypothetical protein
MSSEEEDEFFECDDETSESKKPKHSLWDKPVGRLSKHGTLTLIESQQPLYIPITQVAFKATKIPREEAK